MSRVLGIGAVPSDTKRPALQCVRIEIGADGLRMVSTDAHRLVVTDLAGRVEGSPVAALVDGSALEQVPVPAEGELEVRIEAEKVLFSVTEAAARLEFVARGTPSYAVERSKNARIRGRWSMSSARWSTSSTSMSTSCLSTTSSSTRPAVVPSSWSTRAGPVRTMVASRPGPAC